MGTTPNRGFPYPEGTDFVASGDDAIEALALAVDGAFTNRMWVDAHGGGEAVAADTGWTLGYDVMTAGPGFTAFPDDGVSPYYTYTGPSGRWFLISVGVRVEASGSSGIALSLIANGGVVADASTSADETHLTICIPVALTTGTSLTAAILTTDAAGAYSRPWLKAVSL